MKIWHSSHACPAAAHRSDPSLANSAEILGKAHEQMEESAAIARKGRHDIMVVRELCRAANEDLTYARFQGHRAREVQVRSALMSVMEACSLGVDGMSAWTTDGSIRIRFLYLAGCARNATKTTNVS